MNRDQQMEATHATFLDSLDRSKYSVNFMVSLYRASGFRAYAIPITRAKTYKDWRRHSFNPDMWVQAEGGEALRVEVKEHRTITFSSARNYRYPDFLICARHSWDMARVKAFCVIHLSKGWEHVGVVYGRTHPWPFKDIWDKRYRTWQPTYYTTLDKVLFLPVYNNTINTIHQCKP